MNWNKYLRVDGTITEWRSEPENSTDREVYCLLPLRRKWQKGEILDHKRLGRVECISCSRAENEDQCGDWGGPSFVGEFCKVEPAENGKCEHNDIIETGQAEPTSCCMPPHMRHMEEWIEPIRCSICGRTGSRYYQFSDDERAAAAARYPDNPPEEYPWDDGHEIRVEWDDLKN